MNKTLRFTGAIPARARDIPTADLLKTAVAAARSAGRHAARHQSRRPAVAERFAHDIKLELDLECQERAAAVIHRSYPDHRILGEENTPALNSGDPDSAATWIIDPIDGTINFAHGLPNWCCSVAVAFNGRILAGAVFAPATNEIFTATADGPAIGNGRPLKVSDTAKLDSALVLTGLDKNRDLSIAKNIDPFRKLSAAVQKTRILGSAALDICRVAGGQADAFFEAGIFAWDIAAAGLIAVRAGGRVTVTPHAVSPQLAFLASNARLHGLMQGLMQGLICGKR